MLIAFDPKLAIRVDSTAWMGIPLKWHQGWHQKLCSLWIFGKKIKAIGHQADPR